MDPRREVNVGSSKRRKPAGYSAASVDPSRGDRSPVAIFSQLDLPRESPLPSTSDPEEMQSLLLRELFRQRTTQHFRATLALATRAIIICNLTSFDL